MMLGKIIQKHPSLSRKCRFPDFDPSRLSILCNQSLNWQHSRCPNLKSVKEFYTILTDHTCGLQVTDKQYQSFSLKYNDRSLDLICKDKDEARVWFSGEDEARVRLCMMLGKIIHKHPSLSKKCCFPDFDPSRLSILCNQRYPQTEKQYQSFSLKYNDRFLDMICKDKDDAKVFSYNLVDEDDDEVEDPMV
nr:hypothetical protein [Tanacetum cinerariifolium]